MCCDVNKLLNRVFNCKPIEKCVCVYYVLVLLLLLLLAVNATTDISFALYLSHLNYCVFVCVCNFAIVCRDRCIIFFLFFSLFSHITLAPRYTNCITCCIRCIQQHYKLEKKKLYNLWFSRRSHYYWQYIIDGIASLSISVSVSVFYIRKQNSNKIADNHTHSVQYSYKNKTNHPSF